MTSSKQRIHQPGRTRTRSRRSAADRRKHLLITRTMMMHQGVAHHGRHQRHPQTPTMSFRHRRTPKPNVIAGACLHHPCPSIRRFSTSRSSGWPSSRHLQAHQAQVRPHQSEDEVDPLGKQSRHRNPRIKTSKLRRSLKPTSKTSSTTKPT